MEDWQKDFLAMLETVTVELEQFFQDVSEVVEAVADEIGEAFEVVADEVQNTIATEINQCLQDLFEPIIESDPEFEDLAFEDVAEEIEFYLNPKVEATLEDHRACIGCRHYHGQVYGGNLLVCGMHPYGWDDENCPDWEGTRRDSSHFHED
ncbi:MAG: hypothetical protein AB4426_32275 [Xenococcaceae cyanobacterium]